MQQFYYGGDVLTMEKEGEILEAVLVENGRIKKAGDFEKVKAFVKEDGLYPFVEPIIPGPQLNIKLVMAIFSSSVRVSNLKYFNICGR